MALVARHAYHIPLYFGLRIIAGRFSVPAFEVGYYPLVRRIVTSAERAGRIRHFYLFAAVAVKQDVEYIPRQIFYGNVKTETVSFRQCPEIHFGHSARIEIPARNRKRAFAERPVRVADNEFFVDFRSISQTVAFRTRAVRIVEREGTRLYFAYRNSAIGTGVIRRKQFAFTVAFYNDESVGEF